MQGTVLLAKWDLKCLNLTYSAVKHVSRGHQCLRLLKEVLLLLINNST